MICQMALLVIYKVLYFTTEVATNMLNTIHDMYGNLLNVSFYMLSLVVCEKLSVRKLGSILYTWHL
jgi:hypothetical protein